MAIESIIFPAEWHNQSAIQLTWPHDNTDWASILSEVEMCYFEIARQIAVRQNLIIVCPNTERLKAMFETELLENISFYEIETNDTWARDHGGITVYIDGKPVIYDFCFNGWGMKFAANFDNLITRKLHSLKAFHNAEYRNMNHFVFEGGGIESDGKGTLLTTELCLLSENRNDSIDKQTIEDKLKVLFGADRVLWLKNGFLSGDDTDSHIDTLARFCNEDTIAYIKCKDETDDHFSALSMMENEIKLFKTASGKPYKLIPLPMCTPCFDPDDNHRLPATYANFLIINNAVLFPTYAVPTDENAIRAISKAFPDKEIVPIDCTSLIRQHGSLHCITMQYPQFD